MEIHKLSPNKFRIKITFLTDRILIIFFAVNICLHNQTNLETKSPSSLKTQIILFVLWTYESHHKTNSESKPHSQPFSISSYILDSERMKNILKINKNKYLPQTNSEPKSLSTPRTHLILDPEATRTIIQAIHILKCTRIHFPSKLIIRWSCITVERRKVVTDLARDFPFGMTVGSGAAFTFHASFISTWENQFQKTKLINIFIKIRRHKCKGYSIYRNQIWAITRRRVTSSVIKWKKTNARSFRDSVWTINQYIPS